MKPGRRILFGLLVLLVASASLGRWIMEGSPRQYWKPAERQPQHDYDYCPDGLDRQILFFAETLKGTEGAKAAYSNWIHVENAHQSSTYLVEVLAAPFVLAGLEPAHAFVCVSTLASLVTLLLLKRWLREPLGLDARVRTAALALYLVHPATLRCFVRPQTDALLGTAVMVACTAGWILPRRPNSKAAALLVLGLSAACFVKIHAVALLAVPPVLAWCFGARGRDLARTFLLASILPFTLWLAVFQVFDLFPTIGAAWRTKNLFYEAWTTTWVLETLAFCVLPLFLLGLSRAGGGAVRHAPLWIAGGGYALLLAVAKLPPIARFQYPVLAVLVAWAMAGTARPGPRPARAAFLLSLLVFLGLDALVVGVDVYGRYVGRTKELAPLDSWRFLFGAAGGAAGSGAEALHCPPSTETRRYSMAEKHRVADSAAIPEGEGRCYEIGEKAVAVFRVGDKLFATDDSCPHVGGPLSEGTIEDGKVVCPWHRWSFDLCSGESSRNAKIRVGCYAVTEEGGGVWVEL